MNKVKTTITSVLFVCLLAACAKEDKKQKLLFPEATTLSHVASGINDEDLAKLEGIYCSDSLLLTYDFHSGETFSLFDRKTGVHIGRSGIIGQGPNEIPRGCMVNLQENRLDVYNQHGFLATYIFDSLKVNTNAPLKKLAKLQFPVGNMLLHNIIPMTDSLYFGAGTYGDKYQYALIDYKDHILDYNKVLYNAYDKSFNKYHRLLSSAGRLCKAPRSNKFAYAMLYSENIDFLKVSENKIQMIQSHQMRNPMYRPITRGTSVMTAPDTESSLGYLDISAGDNMVYALYSEKKIASSRCSNIIRVFDWDGNPAKCYILDKDAYYITVNEKDGIIYAATKNDNSGWSIVKYRL